MFRFFGNSDGYPRFLANNPGGDNVAWVFAPSKGFNVTKLAKQCYLYLTNKINPDFASWPQKFCAMKRDSGSSLIISASDDSKILDCLYNNSLPICDKGISTMNLTLICTFIITALLMAGLCTGIFCYFRSRRESSSTVNESTSLRVSQP